jgi:hypothetical protein
MVPPDAGPLPAAHEAHLDTFIALRYVQNALWVLENDPRDNERLWLTKVRRNLAAVDVVVKPPTVSR